MKILFLADSNSPHTIRWAKSLVMYKFEVIIFTLHTPNELLFRETPEVKIVSFNISRRLQSKDEDSLQKIIYPYAVFKLKKIIREFRPDIVHAHYASSYGLLGALSGFHPFVLSIWGSDLFRFPNYSYLHKSIIKLNLHKADKILATSKTLKLEAHKYTSKDVTVIPFGIDTQLFRPNNVNSIFNSDNLVIGTIKALEINYGIEYLIKAFDIIRHNFPNISLKLLLVGSGTQRTNYEKLVNELGLSNYVHFTGFVNHEKIPDYQNMLDIYVAMSLQESFGVAILEACSCGTPVIVSDVGGLPGVVDHGITGYIVESQNVQALVDSLTKLILDPVLRDTMGRNGRQKVLREFDWKESVQKMISVYNGVIDIK
ncbi:MAG: glycosyltransferase [Ignavibacteriaceae bacterium]